MAKTKKAWFIGFDGVTYEIPHLVGKELKLSDLYPLISIDCDIVERVHIKNGVEIWVDEEGLCKSDWVFNEKASKIYQDAYPAIDPREIGLVGNAILIDNTKDGNFMEAYA